MAFVTRDPFARQELHRERVYVNLATGSCAWCGSVRNAGRSGKVYLYRFRVETDGGSVHADARLFCSRDCRESYHG